MTSLVKTIARAALCAVGLSFGTAPTSAAPAFGQARFDTVAGQASSLVVQVQNRGRLHGSRHYGGRHYGGRHYGGRHYAYGGNRFYRHGGRNVVLGIGAVIIGGIVLSEAARAEHRSTHGDDWQRCANTYRSFETDTGMYTGYDGVRRQCPYLN